MEYNGKLYGKIGNKYFDTSKTSEYFDNMPKKIVTEFLTDLKEQVGTYRIKDIDLDLAVKTFLKSYNEKN